MLNANTPISPIELQQIPAFDSLTQMQVDQLAGVMIRQTYSPGQLIFMEGDYSNGLWFVGEGRVKIIKQSLNGRVQGLCLMNRGKCFGSCPLFDMEKNPATAQALDHVTLYVLPEAYLKHFSQRDSQLVSALLHIYSQRLEHLARISEVLGTWTVDDRINDCLLTYANQDKGVIVVELTHEKLAALSGTVREVVTRHLAQLEQIGVVRIEPGHVFLLNPDALRPPCAYEE